MDFMRGKRGERKTRWKTSPIQKVNGSFSIVLHSGFLSLTKSINQTEPYGITQMEPVFTYEFNSLGISHQNSTITKNDGNFLNKPGLIFTVDTLESEHPM